MCQNKRATRRMINDIILHIYQESYVFNNCNQVFHLLSRFCRSNAVRTQCVPHILDHHISMKNMSRSRVRRLPIAVSGMYVRVSRQSARCPRSGNDSNISQRFTNTHTPAEVKNLFFFFILSLVFSVFIFRLLFWHINVQLHSTRTEEWVGVQGFSSGENIQSHAAYAWTHKPAIKQSYISGLHGKWQLLRVSTCASLSSYELRQWCKRTQCHNGSLSGFVRLFGKLQFSHQRKSKEHICPDAWDLRPHAHTIAFLFVFGLSSFSRFTSIMLYFHFSFLWLRAQALFLCVWVCTSARHAMPY